MNALTPINSWQDQPALKAQFAQRGRVQIRSFLDAGFAQKLSQAVAALEWRLVLNEGKKHFDIHPLQIKQLGAQKMRLIRQAAQARAGREFQYLYENYPVFDILKAGKPIDPLILGVYKALNTPEFHQRLTELTALPVDFCDIQATRYRAGHFLTEHDDAVDGKNRQMAFVLSLSPRWKASWGGRLEFFDENGGVEDTLIPTFNALSLFRVPQPHQVTKVNIAAKTPRLSLTGWFRTR